MVLASSGWRGELRDAGIAVNALWPRTVIATAAIENLLGGEAVLRGSRSPAIVADAAHGVLTRRARCTGNYFIDEEGAALGRRDRVRPLPGSAGRRAHLGLLPLTRYGTSEQSPAPSPRDPERHRRPLARRARWGLLGQGAHRGGPRRIRRGRRRGRRRRESWTSRGSKPSSDRGLRAHAGIAKATEACARSRGGSRRSAWGDVRSPGSRVRLVARPRADAQSTLRHGRDALVASLREERTAPGALRRRPCGLDVDGKTLRWLSHSKGVGSAQATVLEARSRDGPYVGVGMEQPDGGRCVRRASAALTDGLARAVEISTPAFATDESA